jgi:hypothetical protein
MALLSALDDFVQRSLSTFPSVWEKLFFVSTLREGESGYRHWGLEQKFGAADAMAAISKTHANLAEELGSTPLAELWLEARHAASREDCSAVEYLNKVTEFDAARPADPQGVVPEHLDYVVTNLSRVARFHSASNRLAA